MRHIGLVLYRAVPVRALASNACPPEFRPWRRGVSDRCAAAASARAKGYYLRCVRAWVAVRCLGPWMRLTPLINSLFVRAWSTYGSVHSLRGADEYPL